MVAAVAVVAVVVAVVAAVVAAAAAAFGGASGHAASKIRPTKGRRDWPEADKYNIIQHSKAYITFLTQHYKTSHSLT